MIARLAGSIILEDDDQLLTVDGRCLDANRPNPALVGGDLIHPLDGLGDDLSPHSARFSPRLTVAIWLPRWQRVVLLCL